LVAGHHLETDSLVRRRSGTAIQADEGLAEYGELDDQLGVLYPTGEIGWRAHDLTDMAVRESGRVEFRGLACLAMVEPQARHDFAGHPSFLSGGDRYSTLSMRLIHVDRHGRWLARAADSHAKHGRMSQARQHAR
jgi:hypothetical protein